MWFLSVLPEWAVHLILSTGVVGLVAGFILRRFLLTEKYTPAIQVISLILFSVGLYLTGALNNSKIWEAQVSELKTKVAEAEAKSEKVNTKVVTKVVTKNRIIKEKGNDVIKYIDREIVKYDNSCPVPKEVVTALNAAAENKTVEEKK